MSDSFKDLLQQGLDQAVQQHVCRLFDVLMSAPSNQRKEAIERFEAGLDKLDDMETAARSSLQGMD
jgi:hypothetical protein